MTKDVISLLNIDLKFAEDKPMIWKSIYKTIKDTKSKQERLMNSSTV